MYNFILNSSIMAHIEPFRALRYDPARVSIPQVVTQPYDKITPEMQDGYYAASPHNLVRVILGKEHAGDHAGENRYSRAARSFQDWRRQGIFLQDPQPSLYLYMQRFTVPGGTAELERRGIIALGRIEDYSSGVIFRHEQTLAKPKADRLELLRATRAHFGRLFMLYSDPASEIDACSPRPATPISKPPSRNKRRIRSVPQSVEDFRSGPRESGLQQDAGQETGDRRRPSSLRNCLELSQ